MVFWLGLDVCRRRGTVGVSHATLQTRERKSASRLGPIASQNSHMLHDGLNASLHLSIHCLFLSSGACNFQVQSHFPPPHLTILKANS